MRATEIRLGGIPRRDSAPHVLSSWFLRLAMVLLLVFAVVPAQAQRQMEKLGRGVIAIRSSSTQAYIGWRLLGDDPAGITFNLYRSANGGAAVKLNATPLAATTDYVDGTATFTQPNTYSVRPIIGGVEQAVGGSFTLAANAAVQPYLTVPLQTPPAGTNASGDFAYNANDTSVGDLDGDGEYEMIVKWDPSNSKDNSQSGYTGDTILDAYRLDGTLLWRIDLGPNIRSGAHYMDFMVYDFDGDGKAELMCRTAPGSKDGTGAYVGGAAKWQGTARPAFTDTDDYRNSSGYILSGPEFLTVFSGPTGAELATARFFPQRDPDNLVDNPTSARLTDLWGDGYGNRFDRFLAAVAYVDGQRPTGIFCRGYYTRTFLTAWDWRNGQLTQRWKFDSGAGPTSNRAYAGQGAHSISVGDLDGDGKDEIAYGACAIDDDGTGLWTTGLGHGDATHLGEMDPDKPGLKFFMPHESPSSYGVYGTSLTEQRNGQVLFGVPGGGDVGRGVSFDIDPRYPGNENWATNSGFVYTVKGVAITTAARPSVNFGVWWDADPLRELLDGTVIDKWSTATNRTTRLLTMSGVSSNNSTKATPNLSGDILGDWREEVFMRTSDNTAMRIYVSTIPATNRLYTLMHDPQYREAIAWQNTGYNQPPHPGFFLGQDMAAPPRAPIWNGNLVWKGASGANVWDAGSSPRWRRGAAASTFTNTDSVLLDYSGDTSSVLALTGTLTPKEVVVHNAVGKDYTFAGAGALSGAMTLTKAGLGALTIQNSHSYTGATLLQQGDLILSGSLTASQVTVEGLGRAGGAGTYGNGLIAKARARVSPGAAGTAATMNVGSRLDLANSFLDFDIGNTPAAARDRIAVIGNLNLTGTTRINLNRLNGPLGAGTYPLITYTGALTGTAANLSVTGLAGAPGALSISGGAVVLTIASTRASNSVTWRGSGGTWDLATTQNWLLGGAPDIFVTGDAVRFDATGAANPTVTLVNELYPASVTVDSTTDYVFAGSGTIGGAGGLTKTNTGKLTVLTANTYTGPTVINGGTLEVATVGASNQAGTLGAASASAANLVLNGGTLRYTGSLSATDHGATLGANGGTIEVVTGSASLILSGGITGAGGLTKTGAGTINIGGVNTYSGGTAIKAGTVLLGSFEANEDGVGSGLVTLDGGTLSMTDLQGNNNCTWPIQVPAGSTGRLNADGRCSLNGALTGGGTFTFYTPFSRTALSGNWSAFTGQINVVADADGGEFRINNSAGYAKASIDLANLVNAYSLTGSTSIGAVSGVAGSVMSGTAWTVGAKNTDATFAGTITGNSVTKVGTGTWTLAGANTYTGATVVTAGNLIINGSLTGSTVSVQSAAGLGGGGSITGNVTLASGSRVVGGFAGSPLAITGNLTASGTITITGPVGGSGVYHILTYSGTLTGTPTFVWSGAGYSATFDTSVPGVVTATVLADGGRLPASLTWTGAASGAWDGSAQNWKFTAGGAATTFIKNDAVLFDPSLTGNAALTTTSAVEPSTATFDVTTPNYALATGGGALAGAAQLIKSGPGTLTLTGANTHTGGTTIKAGLVILNDEAASSGGADTGGALGTGPLTLEGGTLQQLDGNGSYSSTNYDLRVPSGANATMKVDSRISILGALTGSGTLNLYVPWLRFTQQGDWSAFTGRLNVTTDADGGLFRIGNATGLPGASVDFGAKVQGVCFLDQTVTIPLGALSGAADASLTGAVPDSNPAGSNTVTWSIGGLGTDTTFAGAITNGSGTSKTAITKVGAGTLTLAGAGSYTGPTTVSAGILRILGSLTASTVTVQNGATLTGAGAITQNVTINAGGTLLADAAGGLTLGGNLVNNGTVRFTGGSAVTVGGAFTNNGVLDLITGPQTLPANFVNNGTVLDSSVVKVQSIVVTSQGVTIAIPSHVGHNYRLQKRASLASGAWADVGAALPGNGAVLTFTDSTNPAGGFYRVSVSP